MIGMLLETSYPGDIRVRKEAESLVQSGLEVLVIVPWKRGELRKETINGVHVERIGKHYSLKRKGIQDIISSLFFVNYLFFRETKKLIGTYGIRHIHVHDLPLAKTAIRLKKYIAGKVILDSHENYPELLEGWFMTKKSLLVRIKNRLLFTPDRWRKYEAKYLPQFDYLITVVEEMRDKFIQNYHLDPDKVMVISNYEKKAFSELTHSNMADFDFTFNPSVHYVLYVGGIGPMRGLSTVIDAVQLLREEGKSVEFVIVGSGNNTLIEELKVRASDLSISPYVHFLGQKPFEVVNYYMQKATINIIPHIRNGHTDFTIPHKLFQIFLSRRPVLVSSCLPLRRHVNACDGGWVFESENKEDLARVLTGIIETDPEEVESRCTRAYDRAMTDWNWENEAERLSEFYTHL